MPEEGILQHVEVVYCPLGGAARYVTENVSVEKN